MTIIDTANALLKEKEDEKPTRQEAENAVKVLIEWAGDDPSREGLIETPKRVVKAFEEYFAGYKKNPQNISAKLGLLHTLRVSIILDVTTSPYL